MNIKNYTLKSIFLLICSFMSLILSVILLILFFGEIIIYIINAEFPEMLGYMIAIELVPAIAFFGLSKFLYEDLNIKFLKK